MKIKIPLKRVNLEKEEPEEEEITICYNIRNEPKENQSPTAGYLYYTIVNWDFYNRGRSSSI